VAGLVSAQAVDLMTAQRVAGMITGMGCKEKDLPPCFLTIAGE